MAEIHYLDNAATTRASDGVIKTVAGVMERAYGNPSSVHKMGIEAENIMNKARVRVAKALGCKPEEIYFTSGGTEADNIALLRAAESRSKQGRHIITTMTEHPAVLNTAKYLESRGFEVNYLRVSSGGVISLEELESLIRPDTVLMSIMLVNNETGALLPVKEAAALYKSRNPDGIVHTDAVQGFMKLKFTPASLGADMLSLSAHKIHGPKGVGALYIRKDFKLNPPLLGGGQEKGVRSGTEPVGLIAGFGVAAEEAAADLDMNIRHTDALRERLVEGLEKLEGAKVIMAGNAIVSFAVMKYPSEVLIRKLEERGIFVSSGSACSRGRDSHVLSAMHVDPKYIKSALRASFSRYNSEQDVDALLDALREI